MTRESTRSVVLGGAVVVSMSLLAPEAATSAPFQVADLNPTASGGIYDHRRIFGSASQLGFNGGLLFGATDGIHGMELWWSDGTAGGTRMVRDLCPGACSSYPESLVASGPLAYFAADDGVHGRELWRTDGSAEGTVLVADTVPGLQGGWPAHLTALGSSVIFHAFDAAHGRELWRSDGTSTGTALLYDINPGSKSSHPSLLGTNGSVLFLTASDAVHGYEVWATDGTPAGTHVLEVAPEVDDGTPAYREYRGSFAISAGLLFFFGGPPGDLGLFRSDGTAVGTVELLEPDWVSFLASLGGRVFFVANDRELWASDGTVAGTELVKSFGTGAQIWPFEGATVGSLLLLRVSESGQDELWRTDGTEVGTEVVAPLPAGGLPFFAGTAAGQLLFFYGSPTDGLEPWVSDGTGSGTHQFAELLPGPLGPFHFWEHFESGQVHAPVCVGESCFVRLYDAAGDLELWVLDVANGSGQQVAEINDQGSALPARDPEWPFEISKPLGALGDELLLVGRNGAGLLELWRSDGSGAESLATLGSSPLCEIASGLASSGGTAMVGIWNCDPNEHGTLWRSNGTAAGTTGQQTPPMAWDLVAAGGKFFAAFDSLYRTDPTGGGERLLDNPAQSFVGALRPAGDQLALVHGESLLLADGTTHGTHVVPGATAVGFPQVAGVPTRLWFANADGAGRELWLYDGQQPAARVADLSPGATGSIAEWQLVTHASRGSKIAVLGDDAIFLADNGSTGEEPWLSDGTETGTIPLADVFPGARSSDPDQLVSTGERAFFVADDGTHGRELWTTDGTVHGTRLLLDIVPGSGSSVPRNLSVIDRHLLFSAYDPVHGVEPWVTDGTPEGTFRIGDVAPGPLSSSPVHFTMAGERVYFAANDNTSGFEPWAVDRHALESTPTDFFTLVPCRVYDSRQASAGPIGASPRRIAVAGEPHCGVPAGARAIAANVTVVNGSAPGSLRLSAGLAPHTTHELVPFPPGRARAQQAMLRLGYGGVVVSATVEGAGTVDVLIDVTGYFQ